LLSVVVIIAGYIIRREVDETAAFAEEGEHGEIPKSPILEAFRLSSADILPVVRMALVNVIAVVATIFGAAYAVQPAYGIGFPKDIYLWIPIAGNILAVIVIPFVGNLSDKIEQFDQLGEVGERAEIRAIAGRVQRLSEPPNQFSAPCHASKRPWSRRSSANLRVAGER
jgi:hypothetical protein